MSHAFLKRKENRRMPPKPLVLLKPSKRVIVCLYPLMLTCFLKHVEQIAGVCSPYLHESTKLILSHYALHVAIHMLPVKYIRSRFHLITTVPNKFYLRYRTKF